MVSEIEAFQISKFLLAWIANYSQIKSHNNEEQIWTTFLCLITSALSTVIKFRVLLIHTKSKLHWTLRHWSTESKTRDYTDFKLKDLTLQFSSEKSLPERAKSEEACWIFSIKPYRNKKHYIWGKEIKLLTNFLLEQHECLGEITKIILKNWFSGAGTALRFHQAPEILRLKTSCIWSAE